MKTIQELVAEFSEMFPCISNKCDNNGTLTVEDCDGEPMQEPCEYCHRKRFEDQAWLTQTLTDIEAECKKEKEIAFTKGEISGLKRGQQLALEALKRV